MVIRRRLVCTEEAEKITILWKIPAGSPARVGGDSIGKYPNQVMFGCVQVANALDRPKS